MYRKDTFTVQHPRHEILITNACTELSFLCPQTTLQASCPPSMWLEQKAMPLQRPDVCESSAAGQSLFAIFYSTTSMKTQTFRQTGPSLPPSCF